MKRFNASTRQSQAGFTLVEVLVVVIIAAILAGIAAPSWLSYLSRQRVGAVRSDLSSAIKSAQQDAIQKRQSVTLTFPEDTEVPTISVNDLPQVLGSDNNNSSNIGLSVYSVNTETWAKTELEEISFDYQGFPITASDRPITESLPIVISIKPDGASDESSSRQCVIIANLLGNVKTAQGIDCDRPGVDVES